MDTRWTIDQLAGLVAEALRAVPYEGQPSARVREFPGKRSIRYYTTLGLLDPPAQMRGRTAYYGRRHLLQLVALKRLQARGLSLVDVQKELLAADDQTLTGLADLPEDFFRRPATTAAAGPGVSDSAERRSRRAPEARAHTDSPPAADTAPATRTPAADLWAEEAAGGAEGPRGQFWLSSPAGSTAGMPTSQPPPAGGSLRTAAHLQLTDGVELVIEGIDREGLDERTLAQLAPELQRLVRSLSDLGLLPQKPNDQKSGK